MDKKEIIKEIKEQISKRRARMGQPFDTPKDAIRFGRKLERLYRAKKLIDRANWW